MATAPMALRDHFCRYPDKCDRCDCEVSYSAGYQTTERDTVAGCFKWTLCRDCSKAVRKMTKPRRARAETLAIIRRASRYSPDFAAFVASWYGVKLPAER